MFKKGYIPWNKNKKMAEEIKARISTTLKGRVSWNKGKTGIKTSNKGGIPWNKGFTKENSEYGKKMSFGKIGLKNPMYKKIPWNKGKTWPEEIRKKMGRLGRKHTEEWKKKMSEKMRGRKSYEMTPEIREKIRLALLGKKQSEETRKKRSQSLRGEKAPNWQGGITKLNHQIRGSYVYRILIRQILFRDNFICQNCKKRGDELNVNHKKPFSLILKENNIKTLEEAINCAPLWDTTNLETLCLSCHKKTDTYLSGAYKLLNNLVI